MSHVFVLPYKQALAPVLNFSKRVLAPVAAAATAVVAHAQSTSTLPSGIADAITSYKTNTTEAIGLVIAAGVVVWALWRLGKKLGWM